MSSVLVKCHIRKEMEFAWGVGLYSICTSVRGSTSLTKLRFSSNSVDWINSIAFIASPFFAADRYSLGDRQSGAGLPTIIAHHTNDTPSVRTPKLTLRDAGGIISLL